MVKFTAVKVSFALLVVLLASARFAYADDAQDWAAIDKIEKRLQQIVLPKFEFHDAKVQDVLDYAGQILREQGQSDAGIPILVEQKHDHEFDYGPPAPLSEIGNRKITVALRNPSLHHALDCVAAVANLNLSIHPDGIHLMSGYEPDYLFTREFQIPAEFFRSVPPGTSDPVTWVKDAVMDYFVPALDWFAPEPWESSHTCVFNDTATRMTVRDTKENLECIEKSLAFPDTPPIPGPEVPKVLSADDEARMQHAWQTTILPKVSYKHDRLDGVIANFWRPLFTDFPSSEHYGLFYESPDSRNHRTYAVVLRSPPDPVDTDLTITYSAENISAWDALHAIARLAHLEVLTTGWSLQLAPHNTNYTRRYLIPPDAWPQSMTKSPPLYADGHEGGLDWLTAGGVQFGEGSFFRFAFKDRTLSVSNTATEHRKIQAMVEKAWHTYYAAQKIGKGKEEQAAFVANIVAREAKGRTAVARIQKALDKVVLPNLNYNEILAEEVLDFLMDRIRAEKIDGHPIAVSILAQPRDSLAPSNSPVSAPPPNSLNRKISVSLENIRLSEALGYATKLASLKYNVRPDGIEIVPDNNSERMFQRDFPIPPDFFPAYEKQDQLDHTDRVREMRQNIRVFLEENGMYFRPGATARISADATRLIARHTDPGLQDIADILQKVRPPCTFPTYELKEPKIITHGENAALLRKLQRIILPEVKFDGMRLIDAVQTLRDLSVRHDTESPPDRTGVDIVLEEAIAVPPSLFSTKSDPRDDPSVDYSKLPIYLRGFNYTGTEVTLLEVLEAVATRGQWELHVDRSSVILRAPTSSQAMITQEYLITPHWAAWIGARSNWPLDDVLRDLLIANGVRFPSGSSCRYHADTSRLTVQNSEAEQRNTRVWVESIWRSYYDVKAGRVKPRRHAD